MPKNSVKSAVCWLKYPMRLQQPICAIYVANLWYLYVSIKKKQSQL